MSNSVYTSLTRQSGLMKEMQIVANNIANAATTGFRAEGLVFAEHVSRLGTEHGSASMAVAEARKTDHMQGTLTQTGGTFDLAIEGDGFFQIETPAGIRLTRAGAFIPGPDGTIRTPEGYALLDIGGAPVFAPADAGKISIAPDGTIGANGQPIGQIGLVTVETPQLLVREDGVRFKAEEDTQPAIGGQIVQGFLEEANVDPVREITRMIEVQRAYEMGQSFLEREDQRLRSIFDLVGR